MTDTRIARLEAEVYGLRLQVEMEREARKIAVADIGKGLSSMVEKAVAGWLAKQ